MVLIVVADRHDLCSKSFVISRVGLFSVLRFDINLDSLILEGVTFADLIWTGELFYVLKIVFVSRGMKL